MQTVTSRPKGVVNPAAAEKAFRLERYLPPPDLAPFIEHFWLVAWTLPDGVVHVQRTLPSPCIHLVFDAGRVPQFPEATGAVRNQSRIAAIGAVRLR